MREPWTKKQDAALKYLRDELRISKWTQIAYRMNKDFGICRRGQKQCRLRYYQSLNPSKSKGNLDKEEMKEFFRKHDELGNKWSCLAKQFGGVTDNYLKNMFHCKLRAAIRKLNRVVKESKFEIEYKIYNKKIIYEIIHCCQQNHQNKEEYLVNRHFGVNLKNKLIEYAGVQTIHNHYKGKSEKSMTMDLMVDLEKFEKISSLGKKKAQTNQFDSGENQAQIQKDFKNASMRDHIDPFKTATIESSESSNLKDQGLNSSRSKASPAINTDEIGVKPVSIPRLRSRPSAQKKYSVKSEGKNEHASVDRFISELSGISNDLQMKKKPSYSLLEPENESVNQISIYESSQREILQEIGERNRKTLLLERDESWMEAMNSPESPRSEQAF